MLGRANMILTYALVEKALKRKERVQETDQKERGLGKWVGNADSAQMWNRIRLRFIIAELLSQSWNSPSLRFEKDTLSHALNICKLLKSLSMSIGACLQATDCAILEKAQAERWKTIYSTVN